MLRWNEAQQTYVIFDNNEARAKEVGLTRYTAAHGPNGEKVWGTDNPYAALPYIKDADESAQRKLGSLYGDYQASWKIDSNFSAPVPAGEIVRGYQKAGVEYCSTRERRLIGDEPGCGKLQPVDTPVLTPKGWIRIGDLQVGDDVYSVDGLPTKVTGVFPQGVKPSYKVTFRDGTSTECGLEHLWAVASPLRRKRAKGSGCSEFTIKTLQQLIDGGLCKEKPGNRIGAKWYIPLVNPIQFPEADLPIDPYVLGVLIGNGYLRNRHLQISSPDSSAEVISEIRTRLPYGVGISVNRCGECPQYNLTNANGIKDAVTKLGLDCYSDEKFIPELYMFSSIKQRWDLLRGLMDTDGSCDDNRTAYHTTSKKLARDVTQLVRSLGGVSIERWYDRSHEEKPEECQVNIRLMQCPFLLSRKASKWSPSKKYPPIRYIRSAEYVGDKESVCIRVEHPSHLYICENYIVTHNTSQALMLSNLEGAERNLIICPANLRKHWEMNVRRWSTIPRAPNKFLTYRIMNGRHGVNPAANYVIISYDLARNNELHEALCAGEWDHLIIDEAHFAKSSKASRTRAIFGGGRGEFKNNILIDKCKKVTALTGTILPNRPRECYIIARAFNHESIDFMSYDDFCHRFNPSGTLENGHVLEAKGRLPELQARLRCNFMVRRLKKDVLKDLPPKQYELTYVEPTGEIREVIQKERMINFSIDDLKDPFAQIWGQISTVRKEMGIAKVPRVIEHMKYLLETEELPKVVLFSHHREVMNMLRQALAEYGIVELRGGMSSTQQELSKQQFIENPNVRVFSGQLDAAGTGIDGLQTVCDRVVFAEPAWTPAGNDQAIDRLHRFGQNGSVLAQFLIAEGSMDERVLAAVIEKSKHIHNALDMRAGDGAEI